MPLGRFVLLILAVQLLTSAVDASEVHDAFRQLTQSIQCASCEVTAGLLYNYSEARRFATPDEDALRTLATVECAALRMRLTLAQQAFAAHLKVFIPRETRFDMTTYEPAEFYSDEEHEAARPALRLLAEKCTEMVLEDGNSALTHLSASEAVTYGYFAKYFCRRHRSECADDAMKVERAAVLAERRVWKKMSKKHRRDSTASRSQHIDEL